MNDFPPPTVSHELAVIEEIRDHLEDMQGADDYGVPNTPSVLLRRLESVLPELRRRLKA